MARRGRRPGSSPPSAPVGGPHLRGEAGRVRRLLGIERPWRGEAAGRGVRLRQRRVSSYTCGVKRDGSVACWGDGTALGQATPPAGEFASVSAGGFHNCGVRRDGSVACWGSNGDGRTRPPAGEFASVSAGWRPHLRVEAGRLRRLLGLGTDRARRRRRPGSSPPSAPGGIHTCGVKRDGSVACWGDRTALSRRRRRPGSSPPSASGGNHTCGVEAGRLRRLLGL